METIMAIVIIVAACMTSMDNSKLRDENQTLKLENQKYELRMEIKKEVKEKKLDKSYETNYII